MGSLPWLLLAAGLVARLEAAPFQSVVRLLQLRVLGLGLLQDGDVGVGVFPEGEEISVGGKGADAGGIGVGCRASLARTAGGGRPYSSA
jgi:hypothetical protein